MARVKPSEYNTIEATRAEQMNKICGTCMMVPVPHTIYEELRDQRQVNAIPRVLYGTPTTRANDETQVSQKNENREPLDRGWTGRAGAWKLRALEFGCGRCGVFRLGRQENLPQEAMSREVQKYFRAQRGLIFEIFCLRSTLLDEVFFTHRP